MSSACAQLDFGGSMPSAARPSLTAASNGTSSRIAALNSRTVASSRSASIPSARAELLERVGRRAGHARVCRTPRRAASAAACVEELERDPAGLGEDVAAVAGVGVVAEVGALVDEAAAVALTITPSG